MVWAAGPWGDGDGDLGVLGRRGTISTVQISQPMNSLIFVPPFHGGFSEADTINILVIFCDFCLCLHSPHVFFFTTFLLFKDLYVFNKSKRRERKKKRKLLRGLVVWITVPLYEFSIYAYPKYTKSLGFLFLFFCKKLLFDRILNMALFLLYLLKYMIFFQPPWILHDLMCHFLWIFFVWSMRNHSKDRLLRSLIIKQPSFHSLQFDYNSPTTRIFLLVY